MSIIDPILAEFEHEVASTRRLLERVPEAQFDWRPHPKSMTLRELASHIVESLEWLGVIVNEDVFTLDMESYRPWSAQSTAELVSRLDANAETAAGQLRGVDDATLLRTWTMKVGDQTVMSLPRVAVVKMFTINHHIHHRGQLDVYLRLRDVPLPQIYGPTADEPDMAPPA